MPVSVVVLREPQPERVCVHLLVLRRPLQSFYKEENRNDFETEGLVKLSLSCARALSLGKNIRRSHIRS